MDNYIKRVEYGNRVEYYNEDGKLHRLDGPAVEWDGTRWWDLYDNLVNENKHREHMDSLFGVILD